MAGRLDRHNSSDQARPIRILAEYLQPMEVFEEEKISDTIVFFGWGATPRGRPAWRATTPRQTELARLVTLWSDNLTLPRQRFIVIPAVSRDDEVATWRARRQRRSIGLQIEQLLHEDAELVHHAPAVVPVP